MENTESTNEETTVPTAKVVMTKKGNRFFFSVTDADGKLLAEAGNFRAEKIEGLKIDALEMVEEKNNEGKKQDSIAREWLMKKSERATKFMDELKESKALGENLSANKKQLMERWEKDKIDRKKRAQEAKEKSLSKGKEAKKK